MHHSQIQFVIPDIVVAIEDQVVNVGSSVLYSRYMKISRWPFARGVDYKLLLERGRFVVAFSVAACRRAV